MQNITESEFQREVEALKAHRRTSVNRPLLDPDLPETAAAHGGGRELLGSDDSGHLSTSGSSASRRSRKGINLSDQGPLPRSANQNVEAGTGRAPFTARRRGADAVAQRQLSASGRSDNETTIASTPVASSNDDTPLTRPLDPSHLFWVPASMHPEISPSDFRRFLHDHTSRAVREQQEQEDRNLAVDTTAGSSSSSSGSSSQISPTSLGSIPMSVSPPTSPISPVSPVDALKSRSTSIARRGSTLRRQYRPENDDEEEISSAFAAIKGRPPMMQRAGSNRQYGGTPTLSIDDLQKLEQLAEEASKSSDPTELRSVLRRTMSLNMPPSALDQVDALPAESEQDAPLIVPRPGQILRRAARTKIRKASFSETANTGRSGRRRGGAGSPSHRNYSDGGYDAADRDADDTSSSGLDLPQQKRQSDNSDRSEEDTSRVGWDEPSYIDEAATKSSIAAGPAIESPASSAGEVLDPQTPTQQSVAQGTFNYFDDDSLGKVSSPIPDLRAEVAQASSSKQLSDIAEDLPTDSIRPVHVQRVPPLPAFEKTRPAPQPPTSPPSGQQQGRPIMPGHNIVKADTMPVLPSSQRESAAIGRPAKEKKSGFGLSWFGLGKEEEDKSSKKEKKERKERERDKDRETDAHPPNGPVSEKESPSFLGSLFGKKKGADDSYRQDYSSSMYSQAGHLTAGSLLDARSKGAHAQAHYYRYPIHVERAVYRLSHIKLANPRRPLYEQVLISNLMFWYLSIINRSQQQQQQQQQQQTAQPQQQATIQQPPSQPAPAPQPQVQPQPVQSLPNQQQQQQQSETERSSMQLLQSAASNQRAYLPVVDKMKAGEESKVRESEGQNDETLSNGIGQDYPSTDSNSDPISVPNAITIPSSKQAVPKQKRGGLVKPNRAPPGTRSSAETAIPAAAYGAQHRQINSELSAGGGGGGLSNGYALPSLSVGQIVQPRTMAAYSMGLGHVYDHQGGSSAKGGVIHQSGGDEHAWLGARERRSPNSDERRSDPLSDNSSQYRESQPVSIGNNRKMQSRVSEPALADDEGSNTRRSNPVSLQRGSADSSNIDTLTSSPSARSFASNTTVSSADHGNAGNDKMASLMESATNVAPIKTMVGSRDEASVLLEAARSSQARRR